VKKREGMSLLGKLEWEDNIKMGLNEIGGYKRDIFCLNYGPVSGHCEYGNEQSGSIKFSELLD
jgi:hypothetical protein